MMLNHHLLFGILFLSVVSSGVAQACKPTGVQCVPANNAYQQCVNVDGIATPKGSVSPCPVGTVCDDNVKPSCVRPSSTTTPKPTTTTRTTTKRTTTTTKAPTTTTKAPTATTKAPTTTTKAPTTTTTTTKAPTITTTSRTTTTTIAPTTTTTRTTTKPPTTTVQGPITPPTNCNGTAYYPAPSCNQYYECIYVMWWWDYKLITCPSGQGFNGTGCATVANCS